MVKTLKVADDWVETPPNKNKGEPHFSEVYNPFRWSIVYFVICFRALGTSHIVYKIDVYQYQIRIMDNMCWGGGTFTTMDRRGKSSMVLLGTWACIGWEVVKITFF